MITQGIFRKLALVYAGTVAGMTYDDVSTQQNPVSNDTKMQIAWGNAQEFHTGIKEVSLYTYEQAQYLYNKAAEMASEQTPSPN